MEEEVKKERRLTKKQQVFIYEYLKDFNATQAAIRAGYSKKTANEIGCENLAKPYLAAEISKEIGKLKMSADEVLTRLADIARGNMADLMDITPTGFTFNLMEYDSDGKKIINPKTKLIKKIKQKSVMHMSKTDEGEDTETIETELELYSALDALEKLGRVHALFTEKQLLTGDINIRIGYDDND